MTVQRDKKYKKKNSRQRCSGLFHAEKANKICFFVVFFYHLFFWEIVTKHIPFNLYLICV